MKTIRIMSATMVASVLTSAAIAGDARQGEELANQWCSNCHLVGAEQTAGGDTAPPFEIIAETAADRTDELQAWLADPHPPMPNLDLTRQEINDLLAYIESLSDQ